MLNDLPLSAQGNLPPGVSDNDCEGRDPYRPSRQIERDEDGNVREREIEEDIRARAMAEPDQFEQE